MVNIEVETIFVKVTLRQVMNALISHRWNSIDMFSFIREFSLVLATIRRLSMLKYAIKLVYGVSFSSKNKVCSISITSEFLRLQIPTAGRCVKNKKAHINQQVHLEICSAKKKHILRLCDAICHFIFLVQMLLKIRLF